MNPTNKDADMTRRFQYTGSGSKEEEEQPTWSYNTGGANKGQGQRKAGDEWSIEKTIGLSGKPAPASDYNMQTSFYSRHGLSKQFGGASAQASNPSSGGASYRSGSPSRYGATPSYATKRNTSQGFDGPL